MESPSIDAHLKQFKTFVVLQQMIKIEIHSLVATELISKTQDKSMCELAKIEALNRMLRRSLSGIISRGL